MADKRNRRLKKTIGMLVGSTVLKVKFPTAVRYNRFVAQFFEGIYDSNLQAVTEDDGLIVINPVHVRTIWNDESELKERKGSKGFFKLEIMLKKGNSFYFIVTGESRARSCFKALSKLINQTPVNEIYTFNQEECMSCFFMFDEEILSVSFNAFNPKVNSNLIIKNGYC